jgi:hypothetical protein
MNKMAVFVAVLMMSSAGIANFEPERMAQNFKRLQNQVIGGSWIAGGLVCALVAFKCGRVSRSFLRTSALAHRVPKTPTQAGEAAVEALSYIPGMAWAFPSVIALAGAGYSFSKASERYAVANVQGDTGLWCSDPIIVE